MQQLYLQYPVTPVGTPRQDRDTPGIMGRGKTCTATHTWACFRKVPREWCTAVVQQPWMGRVEGTRTRSKEDRQITLGEKEENWSTGLVPGPGSFIVGWGSWVHFGEPKGLA